MQRIPRHIAIIMDGNGRWATKRGLPRSAGHKEGVETVKRITEEAVSLGVEYLTLYTFSTENWNRPSDEIAALMALILDSLEEEIFMANNVRFRVIGDRSKLPSVVNNKLAECERNTAGNSKMTMIVALSYSARWEITEAAKQIASKAVQGKLDISQIVHARPGTAYPHRRGVPAEQLPFMAMRLHGTVLLRHILARLQRKGLPTGYNIIPVKATQVRKNRRTGRSRKRKVKSLRENTHYNI